MNKAQFLQELALELEKQKIEDSKDIITEYEEHFTFKLEDGYSEQEIASKLGQPAEIAAQYATFSAGTTGKKANIMIWIGLVVLDIIIALFLIMLTAWILVMGMFVIALAASGVLMIFNLNVAGLIPFMPRVSAFLLGIACFALAALVTIVTIYFFMYSAQLMRSYIVWHRRIITNAPKHPPVAKYPILTVKQRRGLRHTALIALAVFGITFLTSFITMVIAAGFMAPWHAWDWFLKV